MCSIGRGSSVDAAERTAARGDGGRRASKTLFRWGSVWKTLSLPIKRRSAQREGCEGTLARFYSPLLGAGWVVQRD